MLGGLLALALPSDIGWRMTMALILIPVLAYGIMLAPRKFPQSERVAAGVSYREMLAEAGFVSAFIIAVLMVFEVARVVGFSDPVKWLLIAALTVGYGWWSRSPGRPIFIVMVLIMIPLAITELGTDSWITSMMTPAMAAVGLSGGWVLIYTMALVLVLRLFAGPLVHRFSPIGLLAISALLAAIGLVALSMTAGVMLLVAATIYGIGKAFFWPTSIGVVSEQSPRGGAITINVVAGVGMLAAGIVGSPLIGGVQDNHMVKALHEYDAKNGTQLEMTFTTERTGVFGTYTAVDPAKRAAITDETRSVVDTIDNESKRDALRSIAILPLIMLAAYIGLLLYFRRTGGYKPVVLDLKH